MEMDLIERVAKPEGGTSREAGQSARDAPSKGGVERRVSVAENAEGRRSSSEGLIFVDSGRPGTRESAGLEGERRARWRESAGEGTSGTGTEPEAGSVEDPRGDRRGNVGRGGRKP
jgi:hypothetical protein